MLALLHQSANGKLQDPGCSDPSLVVMTPSQMLSMASPAGSPCSNKETNRPFQCQEPGCGRRFNRKFTLSEHMKTHTGEKPYMCPVVTCGKRFSTSGNLARHKRLHASIKPFECTIDGCKRSFPNEIKLQQHLKIHMGGKSHMCKTPGCGKSFSTAGNLTRHMKNHHHIISGVSSPGAYASSSPVSVTGILDYAMPSFAAGPANVPLTSYANSVSSPFQNSPPLHPSMTNLFYAFHGSAMDDAVSDPTQGSYCGESALHAYEDLQYIPSLQGTEHGLFDDVIRFQLTQNHMPRLL